MTGSDDNNKDDNNNNNSSGKDNVNKLADLAAATNADDNESGSNQGVLRLQCRGKGITKKYTNYSLLMVARQAKRGGASQGSHLQRVRLLFSRKSEKHKAHSQGGQGGVCTWGCSLSLLNEHGH
jgi:hypothetical protein